MPRAVPPLEEPVPIVIQPLPPTPPPQAAQPEKEESTEDKSTAPAGRCRDAEFPGH